MGASELAFGDDRMQLKIERLLKWCSMNDVLINSQLQIRMDDCGGMGVFSADTTIEPSTTLVKIKKSSVLSIRSSTESSSDAMGAIPYGLDAQLELAVVLYAEILKGPKSHWHGYVQSLPQCVDLPLFWVIEKDRNEDASESVLWLRGTEAEKILLTRGEGQQFVWDEIVAFYESVAAPRISSLLSRWEGAESGPSLQGFFHAFSLVSSRAFVVDAYQGLAMVPIADVFNHTTDNHVHLESEFDVCPECGSYRQCDHDHDPKSHDEPKDNEEDWDSLEDDLYYEMVANAAVPPDSEVFNTYGEGLSNAQLLNRYGFVLDINENDRISWTLDAIFLDFPGISSDVLSQLNLILRKPLPEISTDIRDSLPHSELLYLDNSTEDEFFVDSDGKCSLQLWIAIFSLVFYESGSRNLVEGCDQRNVLFRRALSTLRLQLWLEGVYGSEKEEDDILPDSPTKSDDARLLSSTAHRLAKLCEGRRLNTGKNGTGDISLFDMIDSEKVKVGPRTRLAISIVATERAVLESCELQWMEVCNHTALIME